MQKHSNGHSKYLFPTCAKQKYFLVEKMSWEFIILKLYLIIKNTIIYWRLYYIEDNHDFL